MKKETLAFTLALSTFVGGFANAQKKEKPFVWEGANLYFLMTDRFNDDNNNREIFFNRNKIAGKLRGFEGGNLKGIIQKIEDGYFTKLGINAIWMTPIVENIHDAVDEGTGLSYGFHGYWTRDWTALDPNFGTKEDLATLVTKAHAKGIRIVLDGVINHTGPVTPADPVWPSDWVRTGPQCDYNNFLGTTECTLVANLPDIKTESENEVALPPFLIEKWKNEGRLEKEMESLDAFFARTGYPRAPKYYIIKWLTDYILEFGIDAYRADTVKHTDEKVWGEFQKECHYAFETWKKNNPSKVLDNNKFFTIAEVYNYGISGGQDFDFGDRKINYFQNGFDNMINFEFKSDAHNDYEFIFSKYSSKLNNELKGYSVLNYVSSHDDSGPFDPRRERTIESGTKLLLSPGISQVYYGDESARPLVIEGAQGDATLRSFMNWDAIKTNPETQKTLEHWQKLGQFRKNHPAIGAGVHQQISATPYVFSRQYTKENTSDQVVIALDVNEGKKEIPVGTIFKEGTKVRDKYSNKKGKVKNGKVTIDSPFAFVLLEARK